MDEKRVLLLVLLWISRLNLLNFACIYEEFDLYFNRPLETKLIRFNIQRLGKQSFAEDTIFDT